MKKLMTLALLAGATICGTASATIINGTSLQEQLDELGANINVHTDQYQPDEQWVMNSTRLGAALLLFELAGYAPHNSFGIYDVLDPRRRLTIFAGGHSAGEQGALRLANAATHGFCAGAFDEPFSCGNFGSNVFGFYLSNHYGTYFSESSLNPGAVDHMVAFEGGDGRGYIEDPMFRWEENEFIFAWEDLAGGGDRDYDDFGVMVESVRAIPVSEPGTLALLAGALIGAVLVRHALVRRRAATRA
ncbi:MAG: DUF4114 domain-containing protein [Steroidobacteraceae bacterium]